MEGFSGFFGSVPDPRAGNVRHDLTSILFIALAALLCGAESCADMADFGEAKRSFLRQILPLPHGTPSHDTFSRVLRLLNPEAFEAAFARFAAAFGKAISGVVAIDGKAVRGAYSRSRKTSPLHLVNVWAADQGLAIAQRLAPGRNEVTGVIQALALLSLEGCIVTLDALHCRADVANAILATGADYALAVKDNQPGLRANIIARIEDADDPDRASDKATKAHNRIEMRRSVIVPMDDMTFPGAAAVACIESERIEADGRKTSATRHFLLSRCLSARYLLDVIRAHWGIENQLHWVLDVHFKEDACRTRKDNAPQNLAILRKIALNIVRTHPDKASIRRKIKKAGWDDQFLTALIAHMR